MVLSLGKGQNETKYILVRNVLERTPIIEITEERYLSILNSRKILSIMLSIEQKFEILLSNFLDLEREMLNKTLDSIVFQPGSYEGISDTIISINKRIINLLTSTRLFIDFISKRSKNILDNESYQKLTLMFNKFYDEYFEYRFMESLRNYVQHRGFPVHQVTYQSNRADDEKDKNIYSKIQCFTNRNELSLDGKFKASVLKESPLKVDLAPTTRVYVNCLWSAHERVREFSNRKVTDSRNIIESAIFDYLKESETAIGLTANKTDLSGKMIESTPLLLDWDDIRISLSKKNRLPTNLKNRIAMG